MDEGHACALTNAAHTLQHRKISVIDHASVTLIRLLEVVTESTRSSKVLGGRALITIVVNRSKEEKTAVGYI